MNQHAGSEIRSVFSAIQTKHDAGADGEAVVDTPLNRQFADVLVPLAFYIAVLVDIVGHKRERVRQPPLISQAGAPLKMLQALVFFTIKLIPL